MTLRIAVVLLFAFASCVQGQNISKGFIIPDDTLSPDRRFGVTVPVLGEHDFNDKSDDPKNSLVEVKTGRVLATIQSQFTKWDRYFHYEELPARWSPDGSVLLWEVVGKWSRNIIVLLKMKGNAVEWQVDVLKTMQQAILARTKQAAPEKYMAARIADADHGSAFPEGFTIDARVSPPGEFPLHFLVELTADVKANQTRTTLLTSHLEGTINADGKFEFGEFHLGRAHPSLFFDQPDVDWPADS